MLRIVKLVAVGVLSAGVNAAVGQTNVVTAPTTSQTITQPAGTSLVISSPAISGTITMPGNLPALGVPSVMSMQGDRTGMIEQGQTALMPDGNTYDTGGIIYTDVLRDDIPDVPAAYMKIRNINTNASFPTAIRGTQLEFGTANGMAGQQAKASTALTIDPNGNVGIGTTTPNARFDLIGDGLFGTGAGMNGERVSIGSQGGSLGFNRAVSTGTIFNPGAFAYQMQHTDGNSPAADYLAFQVWSPSGAAVSTNALTINGNGFVGIGTANPTSLLEINGALKVDGGITTQSITFPNGSVLSSALPASLFSSNGNIGVGNSTPYASLDVGPLVGPFPQAANSGSGGLIRNNAPADASPFTQARLILYGGPGVDTTNWGYFAYGADASMRLVYARTGTNAPAPLLWGTSTAMDGTGTFTPTMALTPTGSLGLGLSNPGADLPTSMQSSPVLEVNGNIALKLGAAQQGSTPNQNTGAGIVFSDGTIQTTAYVGTSCPITADLVMPNKTIVAQGGDYAESVDVNGDKASYEPGDVMVIDPDNPERFLKSSTPYSTLVAGIYSTKPGYVGRRQQGDPKLAKTEIPMAMIGIVPTKVTTENGPIKVGDLLVTSSTSGYAMKGTDRSMMGGAIVGKALRNMDSGSGLIEALVSLQ